MLSDDEIMAQVLAVFQEEQAEHRQAIGEILLELERQPEHPQRADLFDQLFREAHSLKGGARAAGQEAVEQLAHRVEDIFSAVRQEQLRLTPQVCDSVHAALDAIGALMQQIAAGQHPSADDHSALFERLSQLLSEAPPAAPTTPDPAPAHSAPDSQRRGAESAAAEPTVIDGVHATTVRVPIATLDALLNETGELTTSSLRSQQRSREAVHLLERARRWQHHWRQIRPTYQALRARETTIQPLVHYLPERGSSGGPHVSLAKASQETEHLLNALAQAHQLIDELQQDLGRHARLLAEDSSRLATVTDRLQSQVRRTRMLPVATIFGPLRIQTREMARLVGKQVRLELDDGGAEADRQVLEQLRDILLHLIRNALDHGIEPPEQRAARNKPLVGRIEVRASVSGDRLTVIVADDGAGFDLERIRQQALARGFAGETDLARMTHAELVDLIFQPGFSTRSTVSALSGRGVGLDIVRAHIERIHGQVSAESVPSAGCRFTMSVPLSLTTSQGLLLRAGNAMFALPLDALQRILEITPEAATMVDGRPALALDGRPVPLIALAELLGDLATPWQGKRQVLLLASGERQVAFLIDEVLGQQELVIQRLPPPLKQVRYMAGATIMPDGRVVPLLDPVALIRASLYNPAGTHRPLGALPAPAQPVRRPTVLVADDSITTRTLEKNILEAAGYQVQLASDGVEAFNLLRQLADSGGCDLLLSDVDMPRMNGFDLTARVRAEPRLKHLPVVLVTSLNTPADRERGIAAGADAYITKQRFDQRALLELISQLV